MGSVIDSSIAVGVKGMVLLIIEDIRDVVLHQREAPIMQVHHMSHILAGVLHPQDQWSDTVGYIYGGRKERSRLNGEI